MTDELKRRAVAGDPLARELLAARATIAKLEGRRGLARKALTSGGTSETDEWNTPDLVLDRVREGGGVIGLDPFFNATCITRPIVGITKAQNSLNRDWLELLRWARDHRGLDEMPIAYCNPPYSQMDVCVPKIVAEARQGCEVWSLVKAATETEWFELLCWNTARAVCFLSSRLSHRKAGERKEGQSGNSATFASALVYHGVRGRRFAVAARRIGRVIALNGGGL